MGGGGAMKALATALVVALTLALARPASGARATGMAVPQVGVEELNSQGGKETLLGALAELGIVAVTGVDGMEEAKKRALEATHACAWKENNALADFDDGTSRVTLAATVHGLTPTTPVQENSHFGEIQMSNGGSADELCSGLTAATDDLRSLVSRTATSFVLAMSDVIDSGEDVVMASADGLGYNSLAEIVEEGEHLEHFHSYRKDGADTVEDDESAADTIEMHSDAGLMIAFTPAATLQPGEAEDDDAIFTSDRGQFFIELGNGTRTAIDFGADQDSAVVFMVGDIMEQLYHSSSGIRATPHAMTLLVDGSGAEEWHRVWYGRMLLPPRDAFLVASAGGKNDRMTFGELREAMINSVDEGDGVGSGMGCSRSLLEVDSIPSCGDNQMYCWMRCMDYLPEANPETCEAQGLELKCLSQRNQVWSVDDGHGDFNPTCTNSTESVTEPPSIPERQSDCGKDWQSFLGESEFDNGLELVNETLYLLWNVTDDDKVKMKMAYDGIAGYLSVGIVNVGGKKNGMNGGHVVMGINDPDPDIFGAPYIGTGVDEYIIDEEESAFRHWSTPVPEGLFDTEMTVTDCFTSMTFTTDSIAGQPLNISQGENLLMWAMHTGTYLKGYHEGRGIVTIPLRDFGHQKASIPKTD